MNYIPKKQNQIEWFNLRNIKKEKKKTTHMPKGYPVWIIQFLYASIMGLIYFRILLISTKPSIWIMYHTRNHLIYLKDYYTLLCEKCEFYVQDPCVVHICVRKWPNILGTLNNFMKYTLHITQRKIIWSN